MLALAALVLASSPALEIVPAYDDLAGGAIAYIHSPVKFEGSGNARCGFDDVWVPGVLLPGHSSVACSVPAAAGKAEERAPGDVTVRVRIDPSPHDQGSGRFTYYINEALPVVTAVTPQTARDDHSQVVRVRISAR